MRADRKLADRFRDLVDRVAARGTLTVSVCLLVVLAAVGSFGAVLREILPGSQERRGHTEGVWQSVLRILDVGTLVQDSSWWQRATGLFLVLLGLLGAAVLVAAVISSFQDAIDRVRNTRSTLPRPPDVLVLGWSEQLSRLLTELAMGAGESTTSVAILAAGTRPDLLEHISRRLHPDVIKALRLDIRSGDRTDTTDLEMMRATEAHGIVILAEEASTDDSEVLKCTFALMSIGVSFVTQTVVAEVCGREATVALRHVTADQVLSVSTNEVLSLILAQALRDRGMGQIFDELTSFRGSEFYFHDVAEPLIGLPFGEAVSRASNCVPVGLAEDHRCRLLPELTRPLSSDMQLVVLATDGHAIELRNAPTGILDSSVFGTPQPPEWTLESVLVVGWNEVFARSITHLRRFLRDGSTVAVVVSSGSLGTAEERSLRACTLVDEVITVESQVDLLAAIEPLLSTGRFRAVAVLPHRETRTVSQADADTLSAMAVARSVIDAGHRSRDIRLVAELRESRTAGLAGIVSPDDLVLSDSLTASVIAQLVGQPSLQCVLADLLDFTGSTISIAPVPTDLAGDVSVTFQRIVDHFLGHGEIALGVRSLGLVTLAPHRSDVLVLSELDGIVVLGAGEAWGAESLVQRMADLGELRVSGKNGTAG